MASNLPPSCGKVLGHKIISWSLLYASCCSQVMEIQSTEQTDNSGAERTNTQWSVRIERDCQKVLHYACRHRWLNACECSSPSGDQERTHRWGEALPSTLKRKQVTRRGAPGILPHLWQSSWQLYVRAAWSWIMPVDGANQVLEKGCLGKNTDPKWAGPARLFYRLWTLSWVNWRGCRLDRWSRQLLS